MAREVVVLSGVRTAIGDYGGGHDPARADHDGGGGARGSRDADLCNSPLFADSK